MPRKRVLLNHFSRGPNCYVIIHKRKMWRQMGWLQRSSAGLIHLPTQSCSLQMHPRSCWVCWLYFQVWRWSAFCSQSMLRSNRKRRKRQECPCHHLPLLHDSRRDITSNCDNERAMQSTKAQWPALLKVCHWTKLEWQALLIDIGDHCDVLVGSSRYITRCLFQSVVPDYVMEVGWPARLLARVNGVVMQGPTSFMQIKSTEHLIWVIF